MDWLVLTIQIHLAAACEPEPIGGRGAMQRDGGAAAPVEDRSRRRYSRWSRWRTGPDGTEERRRRWWTGADEDTRGVAGGGPDRRSGGTRWWTGGRRTSSQQPEKWTCGGAARARARTRRVRVYPSLGCSSLLDHATATLRLEWGVRRRTDRTAPRWGQRRAGSSGPLTKMFRYWSFSQMCRLLHWL